VTLVFWLSVGILLYTYVLYPVGLYGAQRVIRKRVTTALTPPVEWPSVSLVVCAYNEEKVIGDKLRNALSLDYPREKLEIIVASDGSTDRTDVIVRAFDHVKLIRFPRTGKTGMVVRTVQRVSSDIVALSDANTFWEPTALKELVKALADPSVGVACGSLRLVNPNGNTGGEGEGWYWRVETLLKLWESRLGSALGANGAIYALRRELFVPISDGFIADDFLIPMKILETGYRTVFVPDAVAWEETAKSMWGEFRRKVRIAEANFAALAALTAFLNPFKDFASLAFVSHKLLRWISPYLMGALVVSNLFLLDARPYTVFFWAQVSFYAMAVFGYLLDRMGAKARILLAPYYFLAMHLALLMGSVKQILGFGLTATRERSER
jgi:poly-beta-1,6-N-acetyl-D-glucosamine synthase